MDRASSFGTFPIRITLSTHLSIAGWAHTPALTCDGARIDLAAATDPDRVTQQLTSAATMT